MHFAERKPARSALALELRSYAAALPEAHRNELRQRKREVIPELRAHRAKLRELLESRIGRHISGVMRESGGVDWDFGRKGGGLGL